MAEIEAVEVAIPVVTDEGLSYSPITFLSRFPQPANVARVFNRSSNTFWPPAHKSTGRQFQHANSYG